VGWASSGVSSASGSVTQLYSNVQPPLQWLLPVCSGASSCSCGATTTHFQRANLASRLYVTTLVSTDDQPSGIAGLPGLQQSQAAQFLEQAAQQQVLTKSLLQLTQVLERSQYTIKADD
jgi:hypothetical protein